MDINNLLALDSNKQNYPNLNLPSDAKYYVSAEEYNVLIKALQSWITDYNAKAQALEDSVYRLPIVTVDSAAPLSDENILSSARTLLEIIKELAKLDDKFLSSLTPDTAEGEITFKKGLSIGDNKNGKIDNYGNAVLNSLKLHQWLEVPELRFNRVEVQLGDKWRSAGGGTIENVDLANKIITLKLADGEIGAVAVGDLCVGMFHSMTNENNATADVDDSKNNRSIKGFATCYFKVEEITETTKNSKFRYSLREVSGNYPKQISPEAFMSFAVFGNKTNTNRQSSVFESRTYQRFLINVNDWEIGRYNVAAQFGELSNLEALGLPNMSGYSAYLKNVYFSGTIFQVKPPKMMDGTWWEWDENIQDYVDTEVKVAYTGKSGFHHTLLNQSLSILKEYPDFSYTWSELHVYEGSKELTYVTTVPTLPATYTVTLEGFGVSPGDLNIGTGTTPFAKTTPIQAMPGDSGSLKFNISGIGSDNKAFSFTTNQTFVKVNSGRNGIGISEIKDFYGLSSIEISVPTEWFSYIPNKPADNYLWNYERIIYTDGTFTDTEKRIIQSKDMRSIVSIVNAYAYSSSETDSPTSGWMSTIAELGEKPNGYFLWVRDDITYTDGTLSSTEGYVVKDGKDGKGIEYIYKRFALKSEGDVTQITENVNTDGHVPNGWTADPTGVDENLAYEYISKRTKINGVWSSWGRVALWSKFGHDGEDGKDVEYIYKRFTTEDDPLSQIRPESDRLLDGDLPTGWTDEPSGVNNVLKYEFVCKRSRQIDRIWGLWSIPALWSRYSSDGKDGKDGKEIEFIYIRVADETAGEALETPTALNVDEALPSSGLWTDDPKGVNATLRYEYVSTRKKINGNWGLFSKPSIWARYSYDGEKGKDGRDIEYTYKRTAQLDVPNKPNNPVDRKIPDWVDTVNGWTDDPIGVSNELPFEWQSYRERNYTDYLGEFHENWSDFSEASLWAKWGKDGKDFEYVFTRTQTAAAPDLPQTYDAIPSGWTANPVGVDDVWEYEWYIKRVKIDGVWGPWEHLQEWRHHVADGHHGKDGANREYIYRVNNDPNFNIEANRPTYSPEDIDDPTVLGWTDDPTNPGPEQQYEWYCYRDKTGGIGNGEVPGKWGPWQGPYLWTRYGKDGDKGEPGNDGSSAPLLYLSASSQIMTCTTSNVPHPNQTITLEAKTQNIVINDLSFQAIAYWMDPQVGLQSETVSLIQPGTDNRIRYLTTAQWKSKYEKVEIKASLGSLNDDVTIHRLADPVEGSSAVVGFLTNGNITFAGFDDGSIIDLGTDQNGQYENGHGEFWVYEGLQRQTTGVEFSVIEQTRCEVEFLLSPRGAYKITDYTVTPLDSASAVLQAEYNGVIIEQVLTISVSRRGEVGEAGTNVPIVYRGVYSPDATYYGNSARVDVVKIESSSVTYYRTHIDTGAITGVSPINNPNYWVNFGANFESVATDLLLAERANIGGFVFYKDQIISQYGRYINGNTINFSNVPENSIANWYPNIVLDGLGGELVINSATVRGNIEAEKGKIGGWLIGENTFTSQLASYTTGPTTRIDSGNLSYVQVTFYSTAAGSWVDTYTQHTNNKYMRIRYGDQAWPSTNIDFIHTGPNKETNIYEKHLQYEFGISSGLTTFPTIWYSYPAGLTSPLSNGSYLWIRQRPFQNISGKPPVIGLWSKPFRVSPIIMNNTISPNISLNGNDGTAIFSGGKVKFNSNGSGFLAGGNITWDPSGAGTLAGGNISWDTDGNVELSGKIASGGGISTIGDKIKLNSDGSGQLAGGNITWDEQGNTTYSGDLKGVTGSFRSLQAANSAGVIDPNVAITLQTSSTEPGRLWFKGDLQHQGYDSTNTRSFRFLTSDMWCRGTFGARARNTAVVSGDKISYYTKGLSVESSYTEDLTPTTIGSDLYFTVPIYGGSGDASGFPVDILLFTSIFYFNLYILSGVKGGVVKVINLTDTTIVIMANGARVDMPTKSYAEFLNLGNHLPGYSSSHVGAGWMKIG